MKYTALFRGINVGGKNIVKMAELKQLLSDMGLHKVNTYIQSGNAVFESDLEETALQDAIHAAFYNKFGFQSDVMIRSVDELQYLIEQIPFTPLDISEAEASDPQVEHLYVYFLNNAPKQAKIDLIGNEYVGPDKLGTGKKEIYFLCHESIRKTKLAARLSKTFDTATVRNWKTVNKLYEMLMNL